MPNNKETSALYNLENAVRVLKYVRDSLPGDDLGANDTALATIEMNKALKELDEIRGGDWEFDVVASYNQMKREDAGRDTLVDQQEWDTARAVVLDPDNYVPNE